MGPAQDPVQAGADEFDRHVAIGQRWIAQTWSKFRPFTRELLATYDYVDGATRGANERVENVEALEHALGVLRETATATAPNKRGDVIPAILNGDAARHEAEQIVRVQQWRSPDFAQFAIVALINLEYSSSVSMLVFLNEDRAPARGWLRRSTPTRAQVAQRWWHTLRIDRHVGTGHGLREKLTEMLRRDVQVPSVLFDLYEIVADR
jgi:hypothetical protein